MGRIRLHARRRPPLAARLARADLRAYRALARRELGVLGPALRPLSRSADHGLLWAGVATSIALLDGRSGRRAALRGAGSLLAASALVNVIGKRATRRTRPPLDGVPLARLIRQMPFSTSMPSGHAASAFGFATGAALEQPLLAAPLGLLAGLVALSRVYIGAHYPSDVLVGAAAGTAVALAGRRVWPLPDTPTPSPAEPVPAPACPRGEGLAIVVNPSAGAARDRDVGAWLRERLPAARVIAASEDDDLAALLHEAATAPGARVLGIAGGDGTANAAAEVAIAQEVPLLVLPAGTLNHLARDLRLPSLDAAADALEAGRAVRLDVGAIDGRPFVNTASVGAYAELVDARERLEGRIGRWPAVLLATARVLRRAAPLEVELDGERHRIWLLFAGNGAYEPEGLVPAIRPRLDSGTLDLRLVDGGHPFARTRLVLALLTGTLARCRPYRAWRGSSVAVATPQDPMPRLARDGETFSGSPSFAIELRPRALVVYAGRGSE